MKASILTFSQTGNTRKVGESIADGLRRGGLVVDETRFLRRGRWKPAQADIIGIGCPVFENRPAEVVPRFLAESGFDFTGKRAFVFITSGGSPARSLWHLARVTARTGASVMGGIQIRGTSSFPTLFGLFPGRPDTRDLEQAQGFGSALAAHLIDGTPLPDRYSIDPTRGGFLYDKAGPLMNYIKKKATPLPVCDVAKCDLCGNCLYECPSRSISIENGAIAFHDTCIVCYRCWHVCPHAAITMRFSPGNGLMERIFYSERMERVFGDIKPDEHVGKNLYMDVLARRIKLRYDRKNPTSNYDMI